MEAENGVMPLQTKDPPRMASNYQKLTRRHGTKNSEGAGWADTLMSNF